MDTDRFLLSVKTKEINEDLKKLEDLFESNNLSEYHKLFRNNNKRIIENFITETSKNNWIDELTCLRTKKYAIKCGDNFKNQLY